MKLITDGNYDIGMSFLSNGEHIQTQSCVEPNEGNVWSLLNTNAPCAVNHINYYLKQTNAGYIIEPGDHGIVLQGYKHYDFLKWIHDQYKNKMFSWQREGNL